MNEASEQLPSAAVLVTAEPQLFVSSIAATCRYFESKLGFAVAFTYGDPPFYAQVRRDGARINLRCVDQPVIDPALRDRERLLSAAITLATSIEVRRLFAEYRSIGAVLYQTLRTEPWGAQNFIVRDPDGNLLLFAGPAE